MTCSTKLAAWNGRVKRAELELESIYNELLNRSGRSDEEKAIYDAVNRALYKLDEIKGAIADEHKRVMGKKFLSQFKHY